MVELREFLVGVAARKAALGMLDTPTETEAMRNKGLRRTPEKRELLRRNAERAVSSGVKPVPSHY